MELTEELLKAHPDHAGKLYFDFIIWLFHIIYLQTIKYSPKNNYVLETLAFKALILQAMSKEEEALAQMKEILKNFKNFKNYTVWHIYGLIYKKAK